jgi:C1A family cysteine protease
VIDHSDEQSAVRHQGDRGTCVAFAVSAGHEWMGESVITRSTEDAMWAAHEVMVIRTSGDETSVNYALQGLDAKEHASEAAWPYGVPDWRSGRTEAALQAVNRQALPGWQRLEETTFPAIRTELTAGNAIVLTIGVILKAWLEPGGSVDCDAGKKVAGNHAVLVVGITENGEGRQLLKVKNSWGARWGQSGYGLISERYMAAYGVCAHVIERDK